MSIHPDQLIRSVRFILKESDTYSTAAEVLILGTIAQESLAGTYLFQLNGGPARGIGQMEPRTEADIWKYHITRHNKQHVVAVVTGVSGPDVDALTYNIAYQILMMRYHYLRVPVALPKNPLDIYAMGVYWDKYYNINPDHGFPDDFVDNYKEYILNV